MYETLFSDVLNPEHELRAVEMLHENAYWQFLNWLDTK